MDAFKLDVEAECVYYIIYSLEVHKSNLFLNTCLARHLNAFQIATVKSIFLGEFKDTRYNNTIWNGICRVHFE